MNTRNIYFVTVNRNGMRKSLLLLSIHHIELNWTTFQPIYSVRFSLVYSFIVIYYPLIIERTVVNAQITHKYFIGFVRFRLKYVMWHCLMAFVAQKIINWWMRWTKIPSTKTTTNIITDIITCDCKRKSENRVCRSGNGW